MATRVNRLLRELNIGFQTLGTLLKAFGYNEETLSPSTKIPDSVAEILRVLGESDLNFLDIIEKTAAKKKSQERPMDSVTSSKKVGSSDLDELNSQHPRKGTQTTNNIFSEAFTNTPISYSDKPSFWIDDLIVLSPTGNASRLNLGTFAEVEHEPLYSVLIGTNGVGKSMLMKEVVDFFIDMRACLYASDRKPSLAKLGQLRGIRYHIDGTECEVIRLERTFLVKIDGKIRSLKDLRLPSVVACHFGAFDKFPTQKVNGAVQTRYDVPYYKYVGAHVNGSMISSSAIAFRLLFMLNEEMNERQRQNICSILDFIGYNHRISLSYSIVQKSTKFGAARDVLSQRVDKDREYSKLDRQKKDEIVSQIYNFYKTKATSNRTQHEYEIDFDKNSTSGESLDELHLIYKLKQYELVNTTNVIFHKQGCDIASDEMSSGEFAMLSTVLSISAAANDTHTLILLDEPELSQHPNWQMSLIDNLDRALKDKVCHMLIATHSHMLVSDLPMRRSAVIQLEKGERGDLHSSTIPDSTYGWSAEEVLLKVFKTATDRNRYFGERIGKLLEQMGKNTISLKEVKAELNELQEISLHLSDIDPMKMVLNTIVETYK